MLNDTIAYIQRRAAAYRNPRIGERLAEVLVDELDSWVPEDSGNLKHILTERSQIRSTADGLEVGVGNKALLGEPGDRTPGTLRAFFEMYPEYIAPAWRYIKPAGKEILRQLRQQGNVSVGGPAYAPGYPARYYYVQEGGPWASSSAAAGVHPQEFTANALRVWRERIRAMIGELVGAR